jgi:hypothetical protein
MMMTTTAIRGSMHDIAPFHRVLLYWAEFNRFCSCILQVLPSSHPESTRRAPISRSSPAEDGSMHEAPSPVAGDDVSQEAFAFV